MKAEKPAVAVAVAGDEWRCRKHPAARSGGGVCPYCLRDRLLRLCPSCARVRPCPCASASPPSSSSSASGENAVGRVHSLIEREHRIARSRSVAATSSSAAALASVAGAAAGVGGRRKAKVWGWTPFWKASSAKEVGAEEEEERLGLARSSSVSATAVEAKVVAAKATAAKARGWHFPSPMKAFRQHRRSSASMAEIPPPRH